VAGETVHVGAWDIALVSGVSVQATLIAYVYRPRWKALLYSLPLPFTLATMALGRRAGVTNASGLLLLLGYGYGVYWLHRGVRVHIVLAIAAAAAAYCAMGVALAPVLPDTDAAFWVACAAVVAVGLAFFLAVPHREEPGHKTPLPVWVKLPVVALVILGLIAMKQALGGFMTVFPMVGVVAAYEKRYSLWTFARQMPVIMLAVVPLMAASRLAAPHVGLGPSLLLGWVTFGGALFGLTRWQWSRIPSPGKRSP